MNYDTAAMIMMSSEGEVLRPVTLSFSLDNIRALENMATITVGEYVWECKIPITISGGNVGINDIRFYHVMPFVINGEYAILGTYNDAYPDTYTWNEIDGVEKYYRTLYANHRVSGVGYTKQSFYSFINPKIDYSLYGTKYDSVDDVAYQPYEVYMGNVTMQFNNVIYLKITNMTPKEQFEFVKSYLESEAYNEPVINIIN